MTRPYTYRDIVAAYERIGVTPGRVVIVCGNLGRLMAYENKTKNAVLRAHLDALKELLGTNGTIAVPSHSLNLVGTETPFDRETTPTHQAGAFSEFVRTLPGAQRSFHPYVSYAAIGKHAADITQDVTRHAFGPETPEARLIELNALHIGIGMPVRITQATTHHVEQLMGVPYRYTREYLHPVMRNGRLSTEPFYMFVRYLASGVQRNFNQRIFESFDAACPIARAPLGRSDVAAYDMRALFRHATEMFKRDIYVWAESVPPNPVYRGAF